MPFQHPQGDESRCHQQEGQPVDLIKHRPDAAEDDLHGDAQRCGGDQRHHGGAQAAQNALHHLHLLVAVIQPAKQADNHQRRQNKAQRSHQRTGKAAHPYAHESGSIDTDGARGHLRDGDQIVEDGHGNPAVLGDHLLLDQRDGHVSATHTEQAHLQEAQEQFSQHGLPSFAA